MTRDLALHRIPAPAVYRRFRVIAHKLGIVTIHHPFNLAMSLAPVIKPDPTPLPRDHIFLRSHGCHLGRGLKIRACG